MLRFYDSVCINYIWKSWVIHHWFLRRLQFLRCVHDSANPVSSGNCAALLIAFHLTPRRWFGSL